MTLEEFARRLSHMSLMCEDQGEVVAAAIELFAEGPEADRLEHLKFLRERRYRLDKQRRCIVCADSLVAGARFKRCQACRETRCAKMKELRKTRKCARMDTST